MGGEKSIVLKFNNVEKDHPRVGGKSLRASRQQQTGRRDHPRVGGKSGIEDDDVAALEDHPAGAKRQPENFFRAVSGSPPRGGKVSPEMLHLPSGDHPRVGGKLTFTKAVTSVEDHPAWGRGKEASDDVAPDCFGITPCVGKEPDRLVVRLADRIHPRGRGKAAAGGGQPPRPGITPPRGRKKKSREGEN